MKIIRNEDKYMKIKKNQKGSSLIELIVTIAIISSLTATVTPIYVHYLSEAKIVADEVILNDAVNLASAMYVMDEATSDIMYYTNEASLSSSKFQITPYGQTIENENSIVMVYKENESFKAKWVEASK